MTQTIYSTEIMQARRNAATEALGWAHAEFCTALDKGEDPRDIVVPEMLDRAMKDLSYHPKNLEEKGND